MELFIGYHFTSFATININLTLNTGEIKNNNIFLVSSLLNVEFDVSMSMHTTFAG